MPSSPINNHPKQIIMWNDPSRFLVAVCGRRFGKTFFIKEKLAYHTERHTFKTRKPGRNLYMGPTRQQAKDIIYEELKDTFRYYGWKYSKNDSELRIERLRTKATIEIRSGEAAERVRGGEYDLAALDEYADIPKHVFPEVIRPALSSRFGACMFFGSPKSFDHFYDMYQEAKIRDDWSAYQFRTIDSPFFQTELGKKEIEDAKRDLDERTFKQEYLASFQNFAGRIIYAFDRTIHHIDYEYDPGLPVYVGQDFNRSPMSSVLFQKVGGKLIAFDEMIVLTSSTEEICREIRRRYNKSPDIIFRPDASGKHQSSSSGARSDFAIIKENGFTIEVSPANPKLIDRWSSVNRAFDRGLCLVNTKKCKVFTKELETICYKQGTCLPHLSDKMTGHAFDAGQYAIYREFPIGMNKQRGPRVHRL